MDAEPHNYFYAELELYHVFENINVYCVHLKTLESSVTICAEDIFSRPRTSGATA